MGGKLRSVQLKTAQGLRGRIVGEDRRVVSTGSLLGDKRFRGSARRGSGASEWSGSPGSGCSAMRTLGGRPDSTISTNQWNTPVLRTCSWAAIYTLGTLKNGRHRKPGDVMAPVDCRS